MDACVDRRVATVGRVHLADDGQSRLEVGKAAGRERRAASCKLEECLALVTIHSNQHVHQSLEARATHISMTTVVRCVIATTITHARKYTARICNILDVYHRF